MIQPLLPGIEEADAANNCVFPADTQNMIDEDERKRHSKDRENKAWDDYREVMYEGWLRNKRKQ